jgi:transcriptional regulator with XRE-family HTH domain
MSNFNQVVGEFIKQQRLSKNPRMTQSMLAKALGVTFQQVQKYEKGMNGMSIQKFLQAVEYLKCDFNQLPLKIWLTNKGVKLEHYDENSNDINKEIDHAEPKEL